MIQKIYVNLHRKCLPKSGWAVKFNMLEETSGQLYGQSRKDVFERYLSVHSNLANLNLDTAVMQQKRSRG